MNKGESLKTKSTSCWRCGIIAVLVLVVAFGYWLAGRYFVIHNDGVSVVAKQSLAFRGTFVDVRGWQLNDFQQHPALRAALETAGLSAPVRTALLRGMPPGMRRAIAPLDIPTDPRWLRSHYVILTEHGIAIIPRKYIKDGGNSVDTFLDIRAWTNDDFKRHPDVRKSLVAAGYIDLLVEMKVAEIGDYLDEMARSMQQSTGELRQKMKAKWKEIFGTENP